MTATPTPPAEETDGRLPARACYALRLYKYDYYEWQEDFAVSFDQDLLKAHLAELDCLYDDSPLVDVSEHEAFADREEAHWVITPIHFLHNVKVDLPDTAAQDSASKSNNPAVSG